MNIEGNVVLDSAGLKQLVEQITEKVQAELKAQQEQAKEQANFQQMPDFFKALARQNYNGDNKEKMGLKAARLVRAFAAAKGDQDKTVFQLEKWRDDNAKKNMVMSDTDMEIIDVVKSLTTLTGPDGGFLVPQILSNELIELLRARAVVRSSGAVIQPMPRGNFTIPRQTNGATASYVGETIAIVGSQPAFDTVSLAAKKLAALVGMSNESIRYPSQSTDRLVLDDMVRSMALREDLAFIRGNGLGNSPTGVRNLVNVANVFAANPLFNVANVTADLYRALTAVAQANVAIETASLCWWMSPRSRYAVESLRDGNGNLAFPELMQRGTLLSFPVKTTTQIPNNLGGGTNESEIYLVDAKNLIIGDTESVEISISTESTYTDGVSTYNAFTQDMTVIRTLSLHDFAMRHDLAGSVITAVTWQ